MTASSAVSAAPITWHASGRIGGLVDQLGILDPIDVGTPWMLDFTFDPETPGHLVLPEFLPTTYLYSDAISAARFQVGDLVYTNAAGDIATNYGLPIGNGVSNASGPGLVQFQWVKGWTSGSGGPDLNLGVGLMLASYNDLNAVDGRLPTLPTPHPQQSPMAGLLWDASLGAPPLEQFTSDFNPAAVPEPTSLLLFGTGIAALALRRRTRRRAQ